MTSLLQAFWFGPLGGIRPRDWLGQTAAPTGGQPGNPAAMFFIPALMIAMVAYMVLSSRSQRKREERQRNDMYSRMSKNDRVLTAGGVIGTVISVRNDEVVLKVDESTNTKMTFLKSAVQRILSDDSPSGG